MRVNRMKIRVTKRVTSKKIMMKKVNLQKKNLQVLSILAFSGIIIPPRGNYRRINNRLMKLHNNYRYVISYSSAKNVRKINRIIEKGRMIN